MEDCTTPPAYESLEKLPPVTAPKSSETTTEDPKGGDRASAQQGLSCTYDTYGGLGHKWGFIDLRMLPNIGTPECLATPWAAILAIKGRDIPRLMREGFFWSTENVLPEEGYMSRETSPEWTTLGYSYKRTWILADKSNDEAPPQWVGRLEVISPCLELLPSFRVQNLSRDNVYAAGACNALDQLIYKYDCRLPASHNFNCIYDDKPLEGWWPWPSEGGTDADFPPALDERGLFQRRFLVPKLPVGHPRPD
ncbi:hypothetical protein C8A00DRAFT_17398, partial [Chaetomidium leptoderma]